MRDEQSQKGYKERKIIWQGWREMGGRKRKWDNVKDGDMDRILVRQRPTRPHYGFHSTKMCSLCYWFSSNVKLKPSYIYTPYAFNALMTGESKWDFSGLVLITSSGDCVSSASLFITGIPQESAPLTSPVHLSLPCQQLSAVRFTS